MVGWATGSGYPIGPDRDIVVTYSTDFGNTWAHLIVINCPAGMNVSDAVVDTSPSIDCAINGSATCVVPIF